MGRKKGAPMYPNKTKGGSFWLTEEAYRRMQDAADRTGKTGSDVIEHCLRTGAGRLTRRQADAIAERNA